MNLTFLIDMNLSPAWVETFTEHGWPAVHWSTVGDGWVARSRVSRHCGECGVGP